jgi:hypothetical protein
MNAEFVHDMAHVHTGHARGDDQPFGNLAVRQATRDQLRYFSLAWTQRRFVAMYRTPAFALLSRRARQATRPVEAAHFGSDRSDHNRPIRFHLRQQSVVAASPGSLRQYRQCSSVVNQSMLRFRDLRARLKHRNGAIDIAPAQKQQASGSQHLRKRTFNFEFINQLLRVGDHVFGVDRTDSDQRLGQHFHCATCFASPSRARQLGAFAGGRFGLGCSAQL